jgi:CHAT domain-containing protein
VKSVAGEASLLHFATHALADEKAPLDSSLALSLPGDWRPGRENGLLQAWEIFEQVRLDADLVTLSACGTALGKEMSGEGILGLTRAFQYAGARSVLASLWGVNDASTADWMVRFYGRLKRGASKDDAVRQAQIETMRRPGSSHPYHWAAFQLSGDWK